LFNILVCEISAQRGNNNLGINGEAAIPIFQNDRGFGFYFKGFYGIGQLAQLPFRPVFRNSIQKTQLKLGKHQHG